MGVHDGKFHRCELWWERELPCPGRTTSRLHSLVRDTDDNDDDDDDDEFKFATRTQEAISPAGVRVASMVSLQSLLREGMAGIPSFENGGMEWILRQLGSLGSEEPFLGLGLSPPQPIDDLGLDAAMRQSETSSASRMSEAGRQFSKKQIEESPWAESLVGRLLQSLAFGAATVTAAELARQALEKPPSGGGRFSPRPHGGGGIGFFFRERTFRGQPGRKRKLLESQGLGFDVSQEIGPGL